MAVLAVGQKDATVTYICMVVSIIFDNGWVL